MLKIYNCPSVDYVIENGCFFDLEIEENKLNSFHGTSTLYSASIEKDGFSLNKKDYINFDMIKHLLNKVDNILNNPYKDWDSHERDKILTSKKNLIDKLEGGGSISTTPISGSCFDYISGNNLGGQYLNFVHRLIEQIYEHMYVDDEDDTIRRFFTNKKQEFKESDRVIYIISKNNPDFDITIPYAHYFKESILPNEIIGKMIITDKFIQELSACLKGDLLKKFKDKIKEGKYKKLLLLNS